MQTIFPILRYADARAAIKFLCETFGFQLRFAAPETGPNVRHAQLALGDNIIMLGSTRGDGIKSPLEIGASSQALCVYVKDIDEHYKRAQAAGAKISVPLKDTDFGFREYHAQDCEGHPWTFGTYHPDRNAV